MQTLRALHWEKGDTSAQISAATCPTCGSLDVSCKGRSAPKSILYHWFCRDCAGNLIGSRWVTTGIPCRAIGVLHIL